MDFHTELQKLIDNEISPPVDPIIEIAKAHACALDDIKKRNENISFQIEEIYDIVKKADDNEKKVAMLEKNGMLLIKSLVNIVDLLDLILSAAKESDENFISAVTIKLDESLKACSIERIGVIGEHIDYKLHEIISAEFSPLPFETVSKVIQCGFIYNGNLIRKAAVIVSKGEIE